MRIKKVARTVIFLVGILLLLVVAAEGFLNFYLNKRLNSYIESKVSEGTHGKYHLSIRSAGLSLLGRSFNAREVLLVPDSAAVKGEMMFGFTAGEFSLNGIEIFDLIFKKEISVSRLNLDNPVIKIYTSGREKKDSSETVKGLYALFEKEYESVYIDQVTINDAKISLFRNENEILISDKNSIYITKFLVNASTDRQDKLFFAEDVRANMVRFNYHLNSDYSISGKNLFASYKDSLISADSVRLVPRHSKAKFGGITGSQARVLFNLARLELQGTDVDAFVVHNKLNSHRAVLQSLLISVYLDKNIEFVATEKPSVQKLIRDISMPVNIDSLVVANGNIIYEHLAPGGKVPGKLSFNAVDAVITGLNNSDTLENTKSILKLNARSRFMNASPLTVNYRFPLNTEKEVFECSGELKPTDLTVINPILENVAFLSIKSGKLDHFTFSFKANELRSDGTMKFYYHDLDIDTEKKDKTFNTGRKLMFMVAKALFINKNNPGKNGKPGLTKIHYDRYPNKYFFYYTWKSLQSGIMEALGARSDKLLKRSDDK